MPTSPDTIVGVLSARAADAGDRVAFRALGESGDVTAELTYRRLAVLAGRTAARLRAVGTEHDRVLLAHLDGLEFAVDLLGCLCAGMVPVPVYPPLGHREIETAAAICAAVRPVAVLTDQPEAAALVSPGVEVVASGDRVAVELTGRRWQPAATRPESLALVQFTSGSTTAPRGVMVTHANLMANQRLIQAAYGGTQDDVIVSWLPLYHDMGLIGSVLHCIYLGASCVLMSPLTFLRQPASWLRAITRYRATISPAPDFAYSLCTRKISETELAELDLRSWRVAISGGEPVRPETVRGFSRRFAQAGFSPQALVPSYGLAEATLLVCAGDPGAGPVIRQAGDAETVSCGALPGGVVVATEAGAPAQPGEVGEIWVSGDSVADGYWEQASLSARTFHAALDGTSDQGYLRTGDLGFVLDGQLFVVGRAADTLVIRGRNHYPQDLEATVEQAAPELRPGCTAAFLTADDKVVIAAELRSGSDDSRTTDRVRAAVSRAHGLRVTEVVLLEPGALPKTSSGKIRRAECRRAYGDGRLAPIRAPLAPAGDGQESRELLEQLAALLSAELDVAVSARDRDRSLAAIGLDSLRALGVQHALQTRFAVSVPLGHLVHDACLADLAEAVRSASQSAEPGQVDHDDGLATAGQRAIWLLAQLSPQSTRYLVTRAFRIGGHVDQAALHQAIADVTARHGALRARIEEADGRLLMRYGAAPASGLATRDLSARQLADRIASLATTPIDLAEGPPIRFTLLRLAGEEPVLVVTAHHLVVDLWSMSLVLAEVARRHGQYLGAQAVAPLEQGPVMAAYATAERTLLAGPAGARLRQDWISYLAGSTGELRLPHDRPRPAVPAWPGEAIRARLDERSSARVRDLARRLDTTPFAVLLSAFAVLLSRTCHEKVVAVGVPTAVRPQAWSAGLVGYCVNTVPVRLDLSRAAGFADLVSGTTASLRRAISLARYPSPLIAEAVGVAGDWHRSALLAVMFGMMSEPPGAPAGFGALAAEDLAAEVEVDGLRLSAVAVPQQGALAELDVSVADDPAGFVVTFRYATELFDRPTIERLLAGYLRVVSAAKAGDTPLASMTLLDPAERRRLVSLMSAPGQGAEPGPASTLYDGFAAAAARWPQAIAVRADDGDLRYGELAARAERLAAVILGSVGDRPADPRRRLIGLHLAPGPRFVTAMLGALRAGYGIVPLPADLPPRRLVYMATDARVAAVIADAGPSGVAQGIAGAAGVPVIGLDLEAAPLRAGGRWPDVAAQDVAYVVYTSGTTGEPKGVPITHANVLPLLHWQRDRFGIAPGERLLQILPPSFDFGLQALLVMLLFGGTCCFPDAQALFSARACARLAAASGVTTLYLTPTFASELARTAQPMPTVTTVLLGGELLSYDVVRGLAPLLAPGARYVNGYGPTEASINCSMRFLTGAQAEAGEGVIPVGTPSGQSRVYVCDPLGDVVPIGVTGEVVIGGPGVSAGYLNRPERSAAAFEHDSFAAEPDARRYRTGDLGVLRPDGELVLLGRLDGQVKVRGFRVEPDELRSVLLSHPAVKNAAVVVRRAGSGASLEAAVIGRGEVSVPELRDYLRDRLPWYLMPTRIAVVSALPTGAHGKLDHELLAGLLDEAGRAEAVDHLDALEQSVARVWCTELDVSSVGRDDNFFDIGGNSLLVGQVMAGLERELGRPLPVVLIFQYPTLAEFARCLREQLPVREPQVTARRRRRAPQRIRITFGQEESR